MVSRTMVVSAAAMLIGCSAPRVNNTRLTGTDLVAMTDAMVGSLANDPQVAARSGRWIIAADRVVNHTNDIIPRREQQAYLARLRALLNEAELPGMVFVREAELASIGRTRPTHVLTAEFYALTHAGRTARSDAYLCTFGLVDLADDTVIWEDRYEVKYQVRRGKLD